MLHSRYHAPGDVHLKSCMLIYFAHLPRLVEGLFGKPQKRAGFLYKDGNAGLNTEAPAMNDNMTSGDVTPQNNSGVYMHEPQIVELNAVQVGNQQAMIHLVVNHA